MVNSMFYNNTISAELRILMPSTVVSSVLLRGRLISASLDDQVLLLGCNIDRTRILRQKSD
jgi:hypothetical protein